MATRLRFRDLASTVVAAGNKSMSTQGGRASVTAITTLVASGTNIQVTATAGGTALAWYSEPFTEAIQINQSVSVNIWGAEGSTGANSGGGILIERTNNAGVVQSTIVSLSGVPAVITEWPLRAAPGVKVGSYTPTITNMAVGDRIKVTVSQRAAGGTMGNGQADFYYDQNPDTATTGDSWIQFGENFRTDEINEGNKSCVWGGGIYG